MMGHLNSFSASGGGNLNKNFAKNTNARGLPGGGMLKLLFDWYIKLTVFAFVFCIYAVMIYRAMKVRSIIFLRYRHKETLWL